MGTDIHIHIEHKSRKRKKFVYDFEADGERIYSLFGVLAGTRGDCDALFDPRGLPTDVSPEVLEEYKLWDGDAHTHSWLTTEEFGKCLDSYFEDCTKVAGNSEEYVREWMSSYYKIYEYMKYSEDEGEPSRIVFWFDN